MESRFYPGVRADTAQLTRELRVLFDQDKGFEVQTMQVSTMAVIQARKSSTLRDLTGLSAALTIKITPDQGGTRVEIGMQKWLDKAAVAAAIVVLTAGIGTLLLAAPALGAYWQHKLTENAWEIIEAHIERKAGGYVPPMPGSCGTCGSIVTSGSPFCSKCGANLSVEHTCASCGAKQKDPSARFCNRCGKPLAG